MTIAVTPESAGGDSPRIYVELTQATVADAGWAGDKRGARTDKVVELARDVMDDAVDLARSCAVRFGKGLQELPGEARPPDDVELQIGITLDSEVGAVVARARAGAQLQLTMTWHRP